MIAPTVGPAPGTPAVDTSLISNIREVTISTDRLEQSVDFYQRHFGYQIVASTELGEENWRRLWNLPARTTARLVLMRIPGHEEGAFRLVQFNPTSKVFIHVPFRPLDSGHAGCDMSVQDLHTRLTAVTDEGYNLASPLFSFVPPNTKATVTEAILLGPTGERLPMVYYTEPGSQAPEPSKPVYAPIVSGFQAVDHDILQEAAFYQALGLQVTRDRSFNLPVVNEAIGLPRDLRFRSLQLAHPDVPYGRVSLVQFTNYRGRNVSDRSDPPNLGILMVSFRTSDLDGLLGRLRQNGARIQGGPLKLKNSVYGNSTVVTVKRPNGAWIEFYT